MRRGVDLSYAQTGLNYEAMAASGVEFAYVRLSYGTTIRDNMAPVHVAGCRAAGIKVGAYHYFLPPYSGGGPTAVATQVSFFLGPYGSLGPWDLPPATDCETESPNGWAALARAVVEFMQQVENTKGIATSVLYNNIYFAEQLRPHGWPWQRDLWLANPSGSPAPGTPLIVQHAPGPVPGCPAPVDIDEFVGTDQAWDNFTSSTTPTPNPLKGADPVSISVNPTTGIVTVERVGANDHLLVFQSKTPSVNGQWTVEDVTAQITTQNPGTNYTVQPG